MYPERFSNLPEATWPRLRALLDGVQPGGDPNIMTIGEPRHAFPDWVGDVVSANLASFGQYPANNGNEALLASISGWLGRRYGVDIGPERIMTLNGTREGLYNVPMALCPERKNGQPAAILTPNPFYQVYMIAALSTGAEPVAMNATAANGFLPDFAALDRETLERTVAAYVCSPANPQGSVADRDYWRDLLTLAEEYDFKVFADECYSEIYRDTPPPGVLEVAAEIGADPERVVAFHSLSKRSNLPGLRSGFVASGPENIRRIRQLRAYAGAPLPGPLQAVATRAWDDDTHVEENRALYHLKYKAADAVMQGVQGYAGPEAGFFLWLPVEDGETAAVKLWSETGVKVLPGAYLSRDTATGNPGKHYIRVAMVAPLDEMTDGLTRLRGCLYG